MKFFARLLFLFFALLVVLFSVSNLEPVSLSLWPFSSSLELPVFLVVFAAFFIGIVLGRLCVPFARRGGKS